MKREEREVAVKYLAEPKKIEGPIVPGWWFVSL